MYVCMYVCMYIYMPFLWTTAWEAVCICAACISDTCMQACIHIHTHTYMPRMHIGALLWTQVWKLFVPVLHTYIHAYT